MNLYQKKKKKEKEKGILEISFTPSDQVYFKF